MMDGQRTVHYGFWSRAESRRASGEGTLTTEPTEDTEACGVDTGLEIYSKAEKDFRFHSEAVRQ